MKRRNAVDVTTVLLQALREGGLEGPLNEHRAIAAWPVVAGEAVARFTRSVRLSNQTLVVQLSSAALRSDLMMRRKKLIEAINAHVGAQVVYELRFT